MFSVVKKNATQSAIMRVNNKRKHAHQMSANAHCSTRFLTHVCAKMVRALCVCVGRLSLTCTAECLTRLLKVGKFQAVGLACRPHFLQNVNCNPEAFHLRELYCTLSMIYTEPVVLWSLNLLLPRKINNLPEHLLESLIQSKIIQHWLPLLTLKLLPSPGCHHKVLTTGQKV